MSCSLPPFRCPMCDRGTVSAGKVPYAVTFRGKDYQIPDADVMACSECGEVFFAPGQSDALQRRASDLARQDMGLLTGAEIAAFRKGQGLTQAQFERALKAPPKTVARWEIGTVLQPHAVNTFLRVLIAHPELLAELLEDAGETVPASPTHRYAGYARVDGQELIGRRTCERPELALAA